MLSKFKEGLVFGAGFSVAFFVLSYTADFFVAPTLLSHKLQKINSQLPHPPATNISLPAGETEIVETGNEKPFYELSPDEKIKKASVIALATYEKLPDGRMGAIIKEFLKKDADVTINYKIGDEYPISSYYPADKKSYGDGVLIFFSGSPAAMQMTMTYLDNRVRSLGGMPMELFREKCKGPDA